MTERITLATDGPHSSGYTKQVADALAEAVRVLVYATRGDCPGLENPGDAYALLSALYTATGRLPQLLEQTGDFLDGQVFRCGDDKGRSPAALVTTAIVQLEYAQRAASDLTARLKETQNIIAGLHVKEGGTDGT